MNALRRQYTIYVPTHPFHLPAAENFLVLCTAPDVNEVVDGKAVALGGRQSLNRRHNLDIVFSYFDGKSSSIEHLVRPSNSF